MFAKIQNYIFTEQRLTKNVVHSSFEKIYKNNYGDYDDYETCDVLSNFNDINEILKKINDIKYLKDDIKKLIQKEIKRYYNDEKAILDQISIIDIRFNSSRFGCIKNESANQNIKKYYIQKYHERIDNKYPNEEYCLVLDVRTILKSKC